MGNVPVVARVVHRGGHEPVYEHRPGLLVDLVLDRLGVHRDLDDDVHVVRHIAAGGHTIEVHSQLSLIAVGDSIMP